MSSPPPTYRTLLPKVLILGAAREPRFTVIDRPGARATSDLRAAKTKVGLEIHPGLCEYYNLRGCLARAMPGDDSGRPRAVSAAPAAAPGRLV